MVVNDGLGDSSEPAIGPVAEEEEAAGVSGAGVATDWTVAGWWGSMEGLAATTDCGQCCVATCLARFFILMCWRPETNFSQLAWVSWSSQAWMLWILRLLPLCSFSMS